MHRGLIALAALAVSGCSSDYLNTSLSSDPIPSDGTEEALLYELAAPMNIVDVNYIEEDDPPEGGTPKRQDKSSKSYAFHAGTPTLDQRKRYITAGFALTDLYCDRFFRHANLTHRRRRFGRTLTNDVGTAVGTILGLITTMPKAVLTGATAITGGLDATWRNFDDAFVVSPELYNVRSLVLAAQDKFREDTLTVDDKVPKTYMTAQTAIIRYAGICSFLGMQSLLNQSLDAQRRSLEKPETAPTATPTPGATPAPGGTPAPTPAPAPAPAAALLPPADARIHAVPPG